MTNSVDKDSNAYRLEQHRRFHSMTPDLGQHPDVVAGKNLRKEASFLVAQAVGEIDRIVDTNFTGYSDIPSNPRRNHSDRRPFTLKDARPHAAYAARLLREAWEMLDPMMNRPHQIHGDHALRTRLVELGWRPPVKPIDQPQCPVVAWLHPNAALATTDRNTYTGLSAGKPRELILKDDVLDHIEWLELGIDEWRTYAIEAGKKLKLARDELESIKARGTSCN